MQQKNNNNRNDRQKDQNPQSHDIQDHADAKESIKAAHDQAEKDIGQDADLSIHSPNDDLDEAETARLGEDETDLV